MQAIKYPVLAAAIIVTWIAARPQKAVCAPAETSYKKTNISHSRYRQQNPDGSANHPRIYHQLEQLVDLSTLRQQTTFGDAIEILRSYTHPRLNTVILWKDIDQSTGVNQNTPILMDGVPQMPLRLGLELVLTAVYSGWPRLDYAIIDGIIIIGVKGSLPRKATTQIHYIKDLTTPGADFTLGLELDDYYDDSSGDSSSSRRGSGRSSRGRTSSRTSTERTDTLRSTQNQELQRANEIIELITDIVDPGSWR